MTRRRIELHNYDKYQPYFHAPLVDRIEGDAQEMILSADGNESSTSGNTVSSLTINASGGVWVDLGSVVTIQQSHSVDSIAGDGGGSGVIFSMPTSGFTHSTLTVIASASDRSFHEQTEVIHTGSNVAIRRGDSTNAGSGGSTSSNPFTLDAAIASNAVQVTYTNYHSSSVNVRVWSNSTLIK